MSSDRAEAERLAPSPARLRTRIPLTSSNIQQLGKHGDGSALDALQKAEKKRAKEAENALSPARATASQIPRTPLFGGLSYGISTIDLLDHRHSDLVLPPGTLYTPSQAWKELEKWKKADKRFSSTLQVQTFLSGLISINSVNKFYVSDPSRPMYEYRLIL